MERRSNLQEDFHILNLSQKRQRDWAAGMTALCSWAGVSLKLGGRALGQVTGALARLSLIEMWNVA